MPTLTTKKEGLWRYAQVITLADPLMTYVRRTRFTNDLLSWRTHI